MLPKRDTNLELILAKTSLALRLLSKALFYVRAMVWREIQSLFIRFAILKVRNLPFISRIDQPGPMNLE